MNKIDRCPVCGSPAGRGWPALIAPFIADYVLHQDVERCHLHECGSCGLRFFAERFTDPELTRLYTDYRGPEYFRARHRHEPWYTESFNRRIGLDPERSAARQESLAAFLRDSGAGGPFESILDYGGDAGQLIPQALTPRSYVYDISGVAPVPGVSRIAAEQDLRPRGYHLVLLSHVLEHVPDPLAMLRGLHALARDDGGWLYVEVPAERPWMGLQGRGAAAETYLDVVRRTGPLLTLIDFYSSACRVKGGFVPPLGFAKLHEHINFFSPAALRAAVERVGFAVLHVTPVSAFGRDQPDDSIACLAQVAARP